MLTLVVTATTGSPCIIQREATTFMDKKGAAGHRHHSLPLQRQQATRHETLQSKSLVRAWTMENEADGGRSSCWRRFRRHPHVPLRQLCEDHELPVLQGRQNALDFGASSARVPTPPQRSHPTAREPTSTRKELPC